MNTFKFKNYFTNYKISEILLFLFILCLCAYAVFYKLGASPVRVYDEALYGVNAIEMLWNKNFLVKYFAGQPDLWGTEPPIVTWLQVLSIKIFGYNEMAIRIPSALGGFFTAIMIIWFCKKELHNIYIGYFSTLILVTSSGYIGYHVVRTGDLDSLLTFFLCGLVLFYYRFLRYGSNKYLIISTFFLLCAVFTKSIAGFLMMPGLLIYTLIEKKIKIVFRNRWFYFSILGFVCILCSYYIFRELLNPGYLKVAWTNEITNRFFHVNESHSEDFYFYFKKLIDVHFISWIYLMPLSLIILLFKRKRLFKTFIIYFWVISLSFLFIITLSKTKIEWYDAPVFPYLAFICGIVIYFLFRGLLNYKLFSNKKIVPLLTVLFLFIFYFHSYLKIIEQDSLNSAPWEEEEFGPFMKKLQKTNPEIKDYTLVYAVFPSHCLFYSETFKQNDGYNIEVKYFQEIDYKVNNYYIYYYSKINSFLNSNYEYEVISQYKNMKLIKIKKLLMNKPVSKVFYSDKRILFNPSYPFSF